MFVLQIYEFPGQKFIKGDSINNYTENILEVLQMYLIVHS